MLTQQRQLCRHVNIVVNYRNSPDHILDKILVILQLLWFLQGFGVGNFKSLFEAIEAEQR